MKLPACLIVKVIPRMVNVLNMQGSMVEEEIKDNNKINSNKTNNNPQSKLNHSPNDFVLKYIYGY